MRYSALYQLILTNNSDIFGGKSVRDTLLEWIKADRVIRYILIEGRFLRIEWDYGTIYRYDLGVLDTKDGWQHDKEGAIYTIQNLPDTYFKGSLFTRSGLIKLVNLYTHSEVRFRFQPIKKGEYRVLELQIKNHEIITLKTK